MGKPESLEETLRKYAASDAYPFHMPGHKRNAKVAGIDTSLDITEITGFDDLYHAEGILKDGQERAAQLYGAGSARYLVNGSTVGNLTAIFASTSDGDRIIMDKDCHRSVYHAAKLRHLNVDYVERPVIIPGIRGSIPPENVDKLLKSHPDTRAVIITSAGYNGVKSDVEKIAHIVHSYGAVLICDEAHGAHFGFCEDYPQSAIKQGADAVVMSLHKTLPAFGQTALLLLNNAKLEENVSRYLDYFQTSSPSYMLMAGDKGTGALKKLSGFVDEFIEMTRDLRNIRIFTRDEAIKAGAYDFDKSRIIILTPGGDGSKIFARLSEQYHIELEAEDDLYLTAISTLCDTAEGFERLAFALKDIDKNY